MSCIDEAGDVPAQPEAGEGHPAGVEHVDDHERALARGMDEDVAEGVVAPR